MISQEQAIEIYKKFFGEVLSKETWYKNISANIKATLLYGSVAKGKNREDSDIDILLITPLEIEEKYTIGEYYYDYEDYTINIVLRSIEGLRIIAIQNNDVFQKEVFRNAITISSSDDEVKNLLFQIKKI